MTATSSASTRPWARQGTGLRDDTGSFSLELAAGWSAVFVALLVLAFAYQVRQSSSDVTAAAREAARAASLTSDPADASTAARHLVTSRLTGRLCAPDSLQVTTATGGFVAGGTVSVTVTCRTRPLIGPTRTITARADEVIDAYRGGLP